MTVKEFERAFGDGAIIHCADVDERREALLYLESLGYHLGPRQKGYLDPACIDNEYLNPVCGGLSKHVACSCRAPKEGDIPFEEFDLMMRGEAMDYTEVIEPLSSLFGGDL